MTRIITIMYDSWPVLIFRFISLKLFDYWFPYCIHLYIWSFQQVTVEPNRCFYVSLTIQLSISHLFTYS